MLTSAGRRIVEFCVRWRWSTIALTLLLAAVAAIVAVRTLKINTDTDALFDPDLPFLVAEREYDAQFPADKDLIVAVIDGPSKMEAVRAADRLAAALVARKNLFQSVRAPEGGAFFARNGLMYLSPIELDELSTRLAAAQPMLGAITADRSARGLFQLLTLAFEAADEGNPSAAGLAPAVTQVTDVINSTLDGKSRTMNWAALFSGMNPGGDKPLSFVLAQPRLDTEALAQGGDASTVLRETAVAQGLTPENGYRVRLTGPVPLSDEEFMTLENGTKLSGFAAAALVAALLTMALGAFRLIIVVVGGLILGLVITMGWAAVSVGEINLISVAFAVMFIGIAVDFAIQFVLRYREERRGQESTAPALVRTGAVMAHPLLLAAIATALGFFAFLPTAYRGVAQLGVIAGGGMVIALILSFTLLPAMLSLAHEHFAVMPVGYQWMAPFNRWLLKERRRVMGMVAALAIAGLAALPRLSFDFDPLRLKDPTTESMATVLDLMGDPWSTPNVLNVLVATPEAARLTAEKFAALPEVRDAVTISSFIPEDQDQKLASLDDLAALMGPVLQPEKTVAPPTREEIAKAARDARAAAQALLAGDKSDVPALAPLKNSATSFITAVDRLLTAPDQSVLEKLSTPLVAGLDSVLDPLREGLKAQRVTVADLPEDLRASWIAKDGRYRVQIFPKGDGRDVAQLTHFLTAVRTFAPDASGPPVIIYETGRIVTRAFAVAGTLALISITILLFAILRRPADVGRVLAPLILAALLTLGTCAAAGFQLNFANIIALPLLLGVGVTFPIYLVSAWRDGESLLLTSPAGRGMFYSALTTGSAFGSLMLSPHPGMASMGALLSISLAYTLLATLLFLPALLGPAEYKPMIDHGR